MPSHDISVRSKILCEFYLIYNPKIVILPISAKNMLFSYKSLWPWQLFFKLNSVVIYTALQIGNCKCHLIFASYLFLVWLRAHRFPICTKDFEIDTHH